MTMLPKSWVVGAGTVVLVLGSLFGIACDDDDDDNGNGNGEPVATDALDDTGDDFGDDTGDDTGDDDTGDDDDAE